MGSDPPRIEPKDYFMDPPAKRRKKRLPPSSLRWIIRIVGWTFIISMVLSIVSGTLIPRMHTVFALLVLLCFIALGVFFDILGLSVAIASPKPFHSMAARRVKGAVQSLRLLKNPEKIISFCSDVVGDVAGIVSGVTASVIVSRLAEEPSFPVVALQVLLFATVSALTVAGKAFGKTLAMKHSVAIVAQMGRAIYRVEALGKRLRRKKKRS